MLERIRRRGSNDEEECWLCGLVLFFLFCWFWFPRCICPVYPLGSFLIKLFINQKKKNPLKKVRWRRSSEEGPTEKARRRRSNIEGLTEKIRQRGSVREGPSERIRQRGTAREGPPERICWKRFAGEDPLEKVRRR